MVSKSSALQACMYPLPLWEPLCALQSPQCFFLKWFSSLFPLLHLPGLTGSQLTPLRCAVPPSLWGWLILLAFCFTSAFVPLWLEKSLCYLSSPFTGYLGLLQFGNNLLVYKFLCWKLGLPTVEALGKGECVREVYWRVRRPWKDEDRPKSSRWLSEIERLGCFSYTIVLSLSLLSVSVFKSEVVFNSNFHYHSWEQISKAILIAVNLCPSWYLTERFLYIDQF